MAKIFISYSRTDRNIVDFLVPQIRNIYGDGSYWYDTAIQGGVDWWNSIQSEIHACQVFLFLMSDKAVQSDYCIAELRKALLHRKQVLQVLLPSLKVDYQSSLPEDLYTQLKVDQYVDLRNEYDEDRQAFKDLSRLLGALNNLIFSIRLPLSTTERWLLHNQFEILQQLNPDHPDYSENFFKKAMEVLSQGYEWYYDDFAQYIYTRVFPYSSALEIVHILDMFHALKSSFDKLADKSGIEQSAIEFSGFGGNDETAVMQFTRFMMESMGRFTELKPEHGLNSHVPMLDAYRKMLKVWNMSRDKYNLSKEDIIKIANARYAKG